MNIAVCVKHIPDPNLPGELGDDYRLAREGVKGVLDPGDEFGVEAALQLKESHSGTVRVVSMGPPEAMESIRRALALGADRAVLVSDDALRGADALVTARVLAAALRREAFDLVVAGVESTDGYTGTMAASLAELLGLPQVTFVRKLEGADGELTFDRQTVEGYQVVQSPLPALITVTAGVNEPRYPSFKGIVGAKKKPVDQLALADLGLTATDVTVRQRIVNVARAEARKAGEIVHDDGTAAARIADFLAGAKVI